MLWAPYRRSVVSIEHRIAAGLGRSPTAARHWAEIGRIYAAELGQVDNAIGSYQRVLTIEPSHAAALWALRDLLTRVQEIDQQPHPLAVRVPEIDPHDVVPASDGVTGGVDRQTPHLGCGDDTDVHRCLPHVDEMALCRSSSRLIATP